MSNDLVSLYKADKQERINQPRANTTEYKAMRARDLERRKCVMDIVAADELHTAEDYYYAAHIMNHGDTTEDAENAHRLALRSSELGYRPARWLAAASYERWQMYQVKPQKYGTNYIYDGKKDRLWDVDPKTTDEERAEWDVPPLAEQLRKAQEANRHKTPMSEIERKEFEANAPPWLKQALEKWRAEPTNPEREHLIRQRTFHRDRFTWLAYLSLAFYGYFLNVLGPITPFLKDELGLTYTISSFHFTAFAIGILLIGIGGHLLIQRIGKHRSLWLGLFGMSLSALLLVVGKSPIITIGASFLMGLIGSLILAIVPAALSDQHGEMKAVALSEANVIASLFATSAPLLVGWFTHSLGGWRWALGSIACIPLLMFLGLGKNSSPLVTSTAEKRTPANQSLPSLFWIYWLGIVLGVSVEFCMIFWSADYMEQVLGLSKADAAQAVSVFLAAMIVGRIFGSRLVQRFSARAVITVSIIFAAFGFLLFWSAESSFIGLNGLFITGLGVANLYPLILSLAINTANGNTVQAGARATLASGTAILTLPLILGSFADAVGIRLAYGVVLVLLISVFLINQIAGRNSLAR
ncbi:MAG TPA: MFS transporter [Anaerolineales bacterium]|nr:MFS transporter [Anaerolineales bacterium]